MKGKLNLTLEQKQQQRLLPLQLKLGKMLELNDREMDDLIVATVDENPALAYKFDDIAGEKDSGTEDSKDVHDVEESSDTAYSPRSFNRGLHTDGRTTGEADATETLLENVVRQLKDLKLNDEELALGEYLAASLDANGYFTRTKAGISDDILMQSGIEPNQDALDKVWNAIRNLDPAGIGAINLKDCLLLQLERKRHTDISVADAEAILTTAFNDFLKQDISALSIITGIDKERIKSALSLISRLNPKPGREFPSSTTEANEMQIIPDISVLPDLYNDDRLTISFTTELPELAIEDSFSDKKLNDNNVSEITRQQNREAALFMKERVEEARNFMLLLKMRNETIYNITKAIVARQKQFFISGDRLDLRPMVLRDIAEDTGYDLSVLSRATSNRYITTVGGIIPFKSLFNEKRDDGTQGGTTALRIMALMKDIIDNEDKGSPFSDDDIVSRLSTEGITVARRTVAKYRETMGIQSARKRKKVQPTTTD